MKKIILVFLLLTGCTVAPPKDNKQLVDINFQIKKECIAFYTKKAYSDYEDTSVMQTIIDMHVGLLPMYQLIEDESLYKKMIEERENRIKEVPELEKKIRKEKLRVLQEDLDAISSKCDIFLRN